MSRSLITLILALMLALPVSAQQGSQAGVVLLVQLRSESNRVFALKKAGKTKLLEEVLHDAKEVNDLMITDFNENFRRCPVYYFMDTNAHLIKQHQFEHILFDEEGHYPANLPVNARSRFRVVYFGYPSGKTYGGKPMKEANAAANSGDIYGRGLVVCNEHFQQIGYHMVKGIKKELSPDNQVHYYYSSRNFDISYGPVAEWLANTWDKFLRN